MAPRILLVLLNLGWNLKNKISIFPVFLKLYFVFEIQKYKDKVFKNQIQNTQNPKYFKYKYKIHELYFKYVFQIHVFQILPNTEYWCHLQKILKKLPIEILFYWFQPKFNKTNMIRGAKFYIKTNSYWSINQSSS